MDYRKAPVLEHYMFLRYKFLAGIELGQVRNWNEVFNAFKVLVRFVEENCHEYIEKT